MKSILLLALALLRPSLLEGFATPTALGCLRSSQPRKIRRMSARSSPSSLKAVWGTELNDFLIAPSILSADFANLGTEVANVLASGADIIHFDVMDNHFVPNLTIGPMVCKALRKHGVEAPIDVHLMVSPVDGMVEDFAKAGASYISFHPEASPHIDRTINLIKSHSLKAGLAFNPSTPLSYLDYTLDKLDFVLIMSVNPGFGGQSFIDSSIDKVREVRRMIDERGLSNKVRIQVDGGVKVDNIRRIALAGCDMFVAGSAILKEPRTVEGYSETIKEMRKQLAEAKMTPMLKKIRRVTVAM